MEVTLETLNDAIFRLKNEVEKLRFFVQNDFDLANEVVQEIQEFRRRPEREFLSHDAIKREFLKDDAD